jgi:hypothetical protein
MNSKRVLELLPIFLKRHNVMIIGDITLPEMDIEVIYDFENTWKNHFPFPERFVAVTPTPVNVELIQPIINKMITLFVEKE